jgi:hypothetical protein
VNMVSHTATCNEVGAQITADCRKIRVHAWPHMEFRQDSRFFVLKITWRMTLLIDCGLA